MPVPQIDTLTPTALADSVSISGFLTWSQVPPSRRTSESTVFSSRNPASLRRPAPSHYMIGDPLTHMHEPDPSRAESRSIRAHYLFQPVEGNAKRLR